MVDSQSESTPIARVAKHLLRSIKTVGDIPLVVRIGLFLLTVPNRVDRIDLTDFLFEVSHAPRPRADSVTSNHERIIRLRGFWLCLPVLRWRNTCYVRALTLYRFLDSSRGRLRIHFGVEPGVEPGDRLRGHAWVTFNGKVLEERAVLNGDVREIYVHPSL
jgi:hypothetical protein